MEIEFFCHPKSSPQWYRYWRDRRMKWYTDLGLAGERLQLREHGKEELSHYSCGTSDIEYAFNTLDSKKADWQPADRDTARTMAAYFANFVKTGTPNGPGLPEWPEFGKTRQVMRLDAVSRAVPEPGRARYEFLDAYVARPSSPPP